MKIGDDLFYSLIPWNFIIYFPLYSHPKGKRSPRRVYRKDCRAAGVVDGDSVIHRGDNQSLRASGPSSTVVLQEHPVGDRKTEFNWEEKTVRGENDESGMGPKDATHITDGNNDATLQLSAGLFLLSNVVADYFEELVRTMPYKKRKYVIACLEDDLDVVHKSVSGELVGGGGDSYCLEVSKVGIRMQDETQEAVNQDEIDSPVTMDLNEEEEVHWVGLSEQTEARVEPEQMNSDMLDEYREDLQEHDKVDNDVIRSDGYLENEGGEGDDKENDVEEAQGEEQTNEAERAKCKGGDEDVSSEVTSDHEAVDIPCATTDTATAADAVGTASPTIIPMEGGFPPGEQTTSAVDLYSAVKQRRNRGMSRCIVVHRNRLLCEEPAVTGHYHCQGHLERKHNIIRRQRKDGTEVGKADGRSTTHSLTSAKPVTPVVTRMSYDQRSGKKKKMRSIKIIYDSALRITD